MQGKSRRWWPVAKALLSLAILFYLGRSFARDLARPELYDQPFHLGWLVPAGLLYLAGLSASALYWRWLLTALGQRPPLAATLRAYFLGQLGKYVPGKALALLLRAALMRRAGVSAGLAGLTAFYEVLVTMAAGALLALLLFLAAGAARPGLPGRPEITRLWHALRAGDVPDEGLSPPLLFAFCLALLAAFWPVVPAAFNRLAARLSLPFRDPAAVPPPVRLSWLAGGLLVLAAVVWPLFGLALALALHAVGGAGFPWTAAALAQLTAAMALAYVAGFVVLLSPGALGVREAFLALLLTPALAAAHPALTADDARGKVLLAALLLRLAWTAAELLPVFAFWSLDLGCWVARPAPDLLRPG
jgi:uncharacterized membrane protein YbhN (UPF0104 family)